MRSILLFVLSFVSLQAFEYGLQPHKVTEGVYCFFGKIEAITEANGGNMVNSCYITTPKGYMVVDSGPTYRYAQQAHAAMRQIDDLPVTHVVTTHEHDDHWLGNSYYKSLGALLIGPWTYEQTIAGESGSITPSQTRMSRSVTPEAFAQTQIVALDRVLGSEPLRLDLGGVLIEIRQLVPKGHTRGDLIVHIPSLKTVLVGDLVFNERITSLRDGSTIGNLRAIDLIDALGAEHILTGHGRLTDATATKRQRRYLTLLRDEVFRALDEGIGMDEVADRITMDEFGQEGLYEVLHRRNVLDTYAELEMVDPGEVAE
jgi:cyclase